MVLVWLSHLRWRSRSLKLNRLHNHLLRIGICVWCRVQRYLLDRRNRWGHIVLQLVNSLVDSDSSRLLAWWYHDTRAVGWQVHTHVLLRQNVLMTVTKGWSSNKVVLLLLVDLSGHRLHMWHQRLVRSRLGQVHGRLSRDTWLRDLLESGHKLSGVLVRHRVLRGVDHQVLSIQFLDNVNPVRMRVHWDWDVVGVGDHGVGVHDLSFLGLSQRRLPYQVLLRVVAELAGPWDHVIHLGNRLFGTILPLSSRN